MAPVLKVHPEPREWPSWFSKIDNPITQGMATTAVVAPNPKDVHRPGLGARFRAAWHEGRWGLRARRTTDAPLMGTDNFDFMLQGIANVVFDQESGSYEPNYHSRSDT
jgi:hypothetical protein